MQLVATVMMLVFLLEEFQLFTEVSNPRVSHATGVAVTCPLDFTDIHEQEYLSLAAKNQSIICGGFVKNRTLLTVQH